MLPLRESLLVTPDSPGAMSKAAHSTVPRGVFTMHVPCMDEEARALLDEYKKSGDPDIADHLVKSLDTARCARWEESAPRMNFTHSSRKCWALLCRLGAAQRPPPSCRPPVSANKVPSHLVQVTKAPANKAFERQVRNGWHQARQNSATDPRSPAISPDEVVSALGQTKLGTAPGYDLVYSEFLKHLGPKALTWLADLFTRMIWEQRIPKIWRQAKIMALAKPGKDPHLAASYPPVSLLRICYKLLECTTLQRISPTVEGLLSVDQAGFRRGRSTCDQVTALTTFI